MNNQITTALAFSALALAFAAIGAIAGDARAKTDAVIDQAKAALTPGEIVLKGTETKAIHDSKDDAVYDVCVKADQEAGPVIVTAGSGTIVLKPGQCHEMSGSHITARPETALTGTMHSTVTFKSAERGPR